jgi:hypothetical protein
LERNINIIDIEFEEEKEDPSQTLFNLVKEHAIDVFMRLKPTKKNY